MVSEFIGHVCQRVLNGLVHQIARINPNPNLLSVIGLSINIFAAVLYGYGRFFLAGLTMIFANIFDMLDGRVARLTGRVTKFGAFLDSSLDRLSDMVVFLGIIIFYSRDTDYHSTLYAALTGAALIGSVMVSYTSARAESLIPKCDVGFLRRPERVVLLILGSLTVWPAAVSISLSASVKGSSSRLASRRPTAVLPAPIRPISTMLLAARASRIHARRSGFSSFLRSASRRSSIRQDGAPSLPPGAVRGCTVPRFSRADNGLSNRPS